MNDTLPSADVSSVLILKADRLCAAAIAQSARSVFPDVTIQLLRRIQDARASLTVAPVDLLVTGVSLPDGDVIDFLAENQNETRRFMRVMVVTEHREPHVLRCLQLMRVDGVFHPGLETCERLADALRSAAAGRKDWTPGLLESLQQDNRLNSIPRRLTPGELRVFAVSAAGCDPNTAADLLGVKLSTIQGALKEIHRKLDLHHKGELHELGAEYGVVRFTPGGVVRPGFALLSSACRRRVPSTVPA